MLLIPRTTEKAYNAVTKNTYVFYVPTSASKQTIAQAVSAEFKVTVLDVRTLVRNGKPKRYSRGRRAYPGVTTLQDKKVAYVTLKAGDKIPVFEEQAADVTAEADKKEAKEAKVVETAKTKAKEEKK